MAITGGGTGAISELLRVPGASATLIEALVPYATESLADFLGQQSPQSCSEQTARAMAMAAYMRAMKYKPAINHQHLLGVGCTAALTTNRQRRGEVKAFLAIQSWRETRIARLNFGEIEGSRNAEEKLVEHFVLLNLARASGIEATPIEIDQTVELAQTPPEWPDILGPTLVHTGSAPANLVIFPGAFNPMHHGHREMIQIAESRYNQPVILEICIHNVDKLPLDFKEIRRRISLIDHSQPVTFSNAPRFAEKSLLFPGATFIVGTDTIKRIADLRYYTGETELGQILGLFEQQKTRFLVFSRDTGQGVEELKDLVLPDKLKQLCQAIPASEFLMNISSTQLRETHED